jgi:multiple sugar transport system permease protein
MTVACGTSSSQENVPYASTQSSLRDVDEIRYVIDQARRRARRREIVAAYAFLLPNVVVFIGFLVIPVLWLIRQSFESGGVLGPATWVGLTNWRDAFGDPTAVSSLKHTVAFTAMYVPLILALAVLIALALRPLGRAGGVVRAIVYLPSIAPLVLAGTVWFFMVHPEFGLLSAGTRMLGLGTPNWLGSTSLAMPTIVSLELWRGAGFWAMLVLAAMLAVPKELYQAGMIDGAQPWQRFWHITFPGIRPTLMVIVLLATVGAMQVFDSVYILTAGGPAGATVTVAIYIYRTIFESGDPGYGAALSVLLVAAVVALTVVLLRFTTPRSGRHTRSQSEI